MTQLSDRVAASRGAKGGRLALVRQADRVEDIDAKFRAAWEVFARTCSAAFAPEATFQAWFAHYH